MATPAKTLGSARDCRGEDEKIGMVEENTENQAGQALDKLLGDLLPAVDLEYSSYQDVRGLATTLSVSEKHALLFLRALKVPILYVPGRKLYSP